MTMQPSGTPMGERQTMAEAERGPRRRLATEECGTCYASRRVDALK